MVVVSLMLSFNRRWIARKCWQMLLEGNMVLGLDMMYKWVLIFNSGGLTGLVNVGGTFESIVWDNLVIVLLASNIAIDMIDKNNVL